MGTISSTAKLVTEKEFEFFLRDINYYRVNYWDVMVYRQKVIEKIIGYYVKESKKYFLSAKRK